MRIIARLEKRENVRFTSHLDVQRLAQRAFRRADIPMAYSNGFNPHPQLSFATALPLGYTSSAEWLDVKLERELSCNDFVSAVNDVLPEGFSVLQCLSVEDREPTLASQLMGAKHIVKLFGADGETVSGAIAALLEAPIIVEKHSKAGLKQVDLRPMIKRVDIIPEDGCVHLDIQGRLDASGGLNIDLLMGTLKADELCIRYTVHRSALYFLPDGETSPTVF